jgi:Predicted subunit of the Multisubunit Na+/H+ antiporter
VTAMVATALTLVALAGTAVVLSPEPARQAVTLSVFGLLLSVLFVLLGAPDVALSQLAVGSAALPLMVLLTVDKIHRGHPTATEPADRADRRAQDDRRDQDARDDR